MRKFKKSLSIAQIAATRDEDIDFSDIPELDETFWRDSEVVEPDRTEQIMMRVKGSVLDYFRTPGKGISDAD